MPPLTHTHNKGGFQLGSQKSPKENVKYLEAPIVFINVDMQEAEGIAWKRNRDRKTENS